MEHALSSRRKISYLDILTAAEALGLKSYDWKDDWKGPRCRDTYIETHAKRYAHLLNTLARTLRDWRREAASTTLLDIGPGFQTRLFQAAFPGIVIDTLGFADPPRAGFLRGRIRQHFEFDLNNFQFEEADPGLESYDIIACCEVIEHLYTMPEKVLRRLKPHVTPGGFLVVQTPNAVQWRRRVRMLLGQNPFDRITASRMDHYREYTEYELREIAAATGYNVHSLVLDNYFGLHIRTDAWLVDQITWPIRRLRGGMTALLSPA